MAGTRWAISMALMSLVSLAGCCRWCDRNCPNCHTPPAAQACVPCCPAPAGYSPPITAAAAPPAGQTWQRQFPAQMNCTCTAQ